MPKRTNPKTIGFSIMNMRDDYDKAFEILYSAMAEQNPDIDADAFDMQLRSIISNFGSSNSFNRGNQAFASLASEENLPSIYNVSGDLLSLAYAAYTNDDKKQALDLFEVAMAETDIETLIDAIQINNKRSTMGIIAEDSDDSSDDSTDSEDDEEDTGGEIEDLSDDDSSDEDEDESSDDMVKARDRFNTILNNLKTPPKLENDEEDEDESKENSKKPMSVKKPEADKTDEDKIKSLARAAANRISLTGTETARREARKIREMA